MIRLSPKNPVKSFFCAVFLLTSVSILNAQSAQASINQFRILDEVLGITSEMQEVYGYLHSSYDEIPVSSFASMSKSEAISSYEDAASKGDLYAFTALGLASYYGIGTEQDTDKALSYWMQGDSKGFIPCSALLADYYIGQNDYATALLYLNKDKGDSYVKSIKDKALCYANGFGVAENDSKAISLYLKASSLGDADSLYQAALCYRYSGKNDKYTDSLIKAAASGSADAARELADSVYNGEHGSRPDSAKAQEYLGKYYSILSEKAARKVQRDREMVPYLTDLSAKGDKYAMYDLSVIYDINNGTLPSLPLYSKYTLQAAEEGCGELFIDAGDIYYYGLDVKQNLSKACAFYLKAGSLQRVKNIVIPSAGASAYLNYCTDSSYDSTGTADYSSISAEETFSILSSLAEADNEARLALAYCHANGIGTKKDLPKALELGYDSSFDENNKAITHEDMARLYKSNRDFVLKEINSLLSLVQKSSANADDYYKLAGYYSRLDHTNDTYSKILENLKMSAILGKTEAFYQIGFLYQTGRGADYDPKTAADYYRMGAILKDVDCQEAMFNLYSRGIGVDFDMDTAIAFEYLAYSNGAEWTRDILTSTTFCSYLEEPRAASSDYEEEDDDGDVDEDTQNIDWSTYGESISMTDKELREYAFLPEWDDYTDVVSSFLAHYLLQDSSWMMYITAEDYIQSLSSSATRDSLIKNLDEEYNYLFKDLSDYTLFILTDYYNEDEETHIAAVPVGFSAEVDGSHQDGYFYIVMFKDSDAKYSILEFEYQ